MRSKLGMHEPLASRRCSRCTASASSGAVQVISLLCSHRSGRRRLPSTKRGVGADDGLTSRLEAELQTAVGQLACHDAAADVDAGLLSALHTRRCALRRFLRRHRPDQCRSDQGPAASSRVRRFDCTQQPPLARCQRTRAVPRAPSPAQPTLAGRGRSAARASVVSPRHTAEVGGSCRHVGLPAAVSQSGAATSDRIAGHLKRSRGARRAARADDAAPPVVPRVARGTLSRRMVAVA